MNPKPHDLTPFSAPGGKFQIKSIKFGGSEYTTDIKTPVPVEKTVHVDIIVIRESVDGEPSVTPTSIAAEMKVAEERYAQVGVKLVWTISEPMNPPKGVDLSNDFQSSGSDDASTLPILTDEEKNLFDGVPKTPFHVRVFYVNGCTGAGGHAYGSYVYRGPANEPYINNAILAADRFLTVRTVFTLAHELGHVLQNNGHRSPLNGIRLMRGGGTDGVNFIFTSKRMNTSEEAAIHKSPLAR